MFGMLSKLFGKKSASATPAVASDKSAGEGIVPPAKVVPDLNAVMREAFGRHRAGELEEAAKGYRLILRHAPGDADANFMLGLVERQHGNLAMARSLIQNAIDSQPEVAAFQREMAELLGESDPAAAPPYLEKLVELEPENATAWNDLGNLQRRLQAPEKAEAAYRRALALQPDWAGTHFNLAHVLFERKAWEEGEAHLDAALPALQDYPPLKLLVAERALEQGDTVRAAAILQETVPLLPDVAEEYLKAGVLLFRVGSLTDAHRCQERAAELAPLSPIPLLNLAYVFKLQGRFDEAERAVHKAHTLDTKDPSTLWNVSLLQLLRGNFDDGWATYEARWVVPDLNPEYFPTTQPLWEGQPVPGGAVMVHFEQGLGDNIQFARYLPLVAERCGGRVYFHCPAPLRELLRTVQGVDGLFVKGEALPKYDYHIPIMSLPRIFKTDLRNIPAQIPYLSAVPGKRVLWRDRHPSKDTLRVGLVWAGSTGYAADRLRSITLTELMPLMELPGFTFVALQKGEPADQVKGVAAHLPFEDWGPELEDFTDTAAAIEQLDLVISVDTSVAHLAGALGKPIWTLISIAPDWRWMLEREDTPWYPTMRLFRQHTFDDWGEVVSRVQTALLAFQAERQTPTTHPSN